MVHIKILRFFSKKEIFRMYTKASKTKLYTVGKRCTSSKKERS